MDDKIKKQLKDLEAHPINQIAIEYGTLTIGEICQRLVDSETLLKRIVGVIQRTKGTNGEDCPLCTGGINHFGHTPACYDLQRLATEIENLFTYPNAHE